MVKFKARCAKSPRVEQMDVDESIELQMLVWKMADVLDIEVVTDSATVRKVAPTGVTFVNGGKDIADGDLLVLDDEGRDDDVISAMTTATSRQKRPKLPPLEVRFNDKDCPQRPGKEVTEGLDFETGSTLAGGGDCKDDEAKQRSLDKTKQKIIKLLNTAASDGSYEAEAKQALTLAQTLMEKHNLSQVELMKEKGGSLNDAEELKGGLVVVDLWNRNTNKRYKRLDLWIEEFVGCCNDNFDVDSFFESRPLNITFYGIYSSCQLAAYAFKVNADRISSMIQAYQPTPSKKRRQGDKNRKKKRRRTEDDSKDDDDSDDDSEDDDSYDSYFDDDDGDDDQKTTKYRAEDDDQKTTTYRAEDDSDFNEGPRRRSAETATARRSYALGIVQGISEAIQDSKQTRRRKNEKNSSALTLYEHSKQVQEDVLKEREIKVGGHRRPSSATTFDQDAYDKGLHDSKEIDLEQRAIRAKPTAATMMRAFKK